MTQTNPPEFPLEKAHLLLRGPSGQLEVMTSYPKHKLPTIVGIVCHPHPLYEGTMHNKVVSTIARAFENLNYATVRFNYRGVGKSEGQYGHMIGEIEDLKAIMVWVKQVLPDCEIVLVGFSFGAYISANVANQIAVSKLITIAPAVNHADFSQLTNIRCPWLLVQGEEDEVVPPEEVIAFAQHPPSPLNFILLPEVSHFFHGKLIELREILEQWLK